MKRIAVGIALILGTAAAAFSATVTVNKSLIGEEDLAIQNSTTETYSRSTSTGGTVTMHKLSPSTFVPGLFEVASYGAVCDGTTDDTAAIQAADTAAGAAGGGIVSFASVAGKTCLVKQTNDQVPAITVSGDNITYECAGATIKASATDTADNIAENNHFMSAFYAVGKNHLTFDHCRFDGARSGNGSAGPRMSFLKAVQTNWLTVRNSTFTGVNNAAGAITVTSYKCVMSGTTCGGSSTNVCTHDIRIENNYFEKSTKATDTAGSLQGVWITGNSLDHMDLASYYEEMPSGYSDGGGIIYLRGLRGNGHINATAACDARDQHFDNNVIRGAKFGIEVWNNNDTYGYDGSTAYNLTVRGNTVEGFGCAWTNSWRDANISGNTCRELVMDATQRAAYVTAGGYIWGALASATTLTDSTSSTCTNGTCTATGGKGFTNMIEARDLERSTVAGNQVDCQGTASGYGRGISIGGAKMVNDTHVVGNTVVKCGAGIHVNNAQKAVIESNRIVDAYAGINIYANEFGATTFPGDYTGNRILGNVIVSASDSGSVTNAAPIFVTNTNGCAGGSNSGNHCTTNTDCPSSTCNSTTAINQEWEISDNTIYHLNNSPSNSESAIDIRDIGFKLRAAGNRIVNWNGWAIRDEGLESRYDNNVFDSKLASPASTDIPFRINGQTSRIFSASNTRTLRAGRAFAFCASTSGTYNLGTVYADSNMDASTVNTASAYGCSAGMPTVSDVVIDKDGQRTAFNGTTRKAGFYHGTGSPESSVTASPGSIYQDDSTGTTYRKASGTSTTGWVSGGSMPLVTTLTIASDAAAVTASGTYYLTCETGTPGSATDSVTSLTGGTDGTVVYLQLATAGDTITVTNATNLQLAGAANFALNHRDDVIALKYQSATGRWVELFRADNS